MRGAIVGSLIGCGLLLGACASTSSTGSAAPSADASPKLKHVVVPMTTAPELAQHPVVGAFERVFCSELFALNDRQVVCADDIRTMLRIEQEKAALGGGDPLGIEAIERMAQAPRRIALSAGLVGRNIRIDAVLQDEAGQPLHRDQVEVGYSGEDVAERARELAARLLAGR